MSLRALTAAATLPVLLALPVWPALPVPLAPATPSAPAADRATTVAAPAVVAVTTRWQGWVRDRRTGEVFGGVDGYPVTRACSGVLVHASGALVTARSCVDPDSDPQAFFQRAASDLTIAGRARSADLALPTLTANAVVEGLTEGTPAIRDVTVHWGTGSPVAATVVEVGDQQAGGIAILSVPGGRLPAAELADSGPGASSPVLGFRAGSTELARVTERPLPDGLTGGPLLDTQGRIVGLAAGAGGTINASAVRQALDRRKVTYGLGPIDRNYRAGLAQLDAGRYASAVAYFDAVLAAGPHPRAEEQRRIAQLRRDTDGERRHPALPWAVVAGVLGLVAAVAAVLVMLTRPRRPGRAP